MLRSGPADPRIMRRVPVTVNTIYRDDVEVAAAKGGENLKLRLGGVEEGEIQQGFVICTKQAPVPCVTRFKAQLQVQSSSSYVGSGTLRDGAGGGLCVEMPRALRHPLQGPAPGAAGYTIWRMLDAWTPGWLWPLKLCRPASLRCILLGLAKLK